ncbi:MAG: orotidine-5'-phosphate decarboxylase [Ruminococcus sp.]|nr:orotidine-5'-phosphate decarboxylase [Ruminococcus sp.]MBR6623492.1 orotidine-5'-phosphate decarboxylase [Ruminococcus sp.]
MSFDRLIEKIIEMKNPTVVGLDPRPEYVPEFIMRRYQDSDGWTMKAVSKAIFDFNQAIIDEIHDIVPAIKPQAAYYEMFGHYGIRTLEKTIRYAKLNGMFVITDGKRNDIGATMEAYASAHIGTVNICDTEVEPFGADALTVNGYLGTDGIDPLLKYCRERDKGIYVLVKTSNPSSGELQDLRLEDGTPVYAKMGDMCEKWGADTIGKYGYSAVGAVVGATYPEQLTELRKRLPHTMFLVPGYGAQGGGAEGLKGGFDENGLGAIVNSSRAVMCAYKKEGCDERDFAKAARREVIRMRDDITQYINLK